MHVKHAEELDEVQIASWRRDRLAGAGFPLPLAARVAADARFDLHALIELTERGYAHALAVRILAPLEGDGSLP